MGLHFSAELIPGAACWRMDIYSSHSCWPGKRVQAFHGCVPVKIEGCFDDHEQTGAENVNFHLKDTNFMDSCKDFGPNFCLAVSFPIFRLSAPVNPVDRGFGNIA